MKTTQEKIYQIQEVGIDFKIALLGDKETGGLLKQLTEYADDATMKNWLILREFGTTCLWLNNARCKKRYSDHVSTIVFGGYFLQNKISYIFQEINRITNGSFAYEIINEFEPVYDSENQKIDQDFWDNIDALNGEYDCKYLINGKEYVFKYKFFPREWNYLNPSFVIELLTSLQGEFLALNLNFLEPEEFITFLTCDEETKNKLQNELDISFYQQKLPVQEKDETLKDKAEIEEKEPIEIKNQEKKKWWRFW